MATVPDKSGNSAVGVVQHIPSKLEQIAENTKQIVENTKQ